VEIVTMDEGRQIDVNDEQPQNARLPRIETLQLLSNSTLCRNRQKAKHNFEIVSTDEGIQIDRRDGQPENANSPIKES
jgi:hypothetical protein